MNHYIWLLLLISLHSVVPQTLNTATPEPPVANSTGDPTNPIILESGASSTTQTPRIVADNFTNFTEISNVTLPGVNETTPVPPVGNLTQNTTNTTTVAVVLNTFGTILTTTPAPPAQTNATTSESVKNQTTIDLFEEAERNMTDAESPQDSCYPSCAEVNKNVVLAICMCIFGGIIVIGIFSYLFIYKRIGRGRSSQRKLTTSAKYTPVPQSENIYLEPITVPSEVQVEQV